MGIGIICGGLGNKMSREMKTGGGVVYLRKGCVKREGRKIT